MQIVTDPSVQILWPFVGQSRNVALAHSLVTNSEPAPYSDRVREAVVERHGGALEHAHYTFEIDGVSRALTHEIRIHRYLSFSQRPQPRREEDMAFVVPVGLDPSFAAYAIWHANIASAVAGWVHMVRDLVDNDGMSEARARSMACCILPTCLSTSMVVSGTARAWRKFLIKRGNARATPEIRRLAILIAKELKSQDPAVWFDMHVLGHEAFDPIVVFEAGDI